MDSPALGRTAPSIGNRDECNAPHDGKQTEGAIISIYVCCKNPPPPLPTHIHQTNNTSEILAAIQTLKIFPSRKIAICTDSSLVYLGATGKAKKWALNNWVGPRGPLSNVEFWKDLLHELDSPLRIVKWVKVPSHVGMWGNEEADFTSGRRSSQQPAAQAVCCPPGTQFTPLFGAAEGCRTPTPPRSNFDF